MKTHNTETLLLVDRAVACGRELHSLLRQLDDVDTDILCRKCGAEALRLGKDDKNHCDQCGHTQTDDEAVTLTDELWPI